MTLVIVFAVVLFGLLAYLGWINKSASTSVAAPVTLPSTPYPVGTPSARAPSRLAPPSASAIPGYQLTYVADFASSGIPKGWDLFKGEPGGDPGAQLSPNHVGVYDGKLVLATYRDKAYGNRWVAGGLCQCGLPNLYGAYFVRSRVTGPGPNEVQLLWPANNQWPPEIDFNESSSISHTTATVHWGVGNYILQTHLKGVDLTKWNTWGVVWTPKKIVYVLNGRAWGAITTPGAVPHMKMTLNLEQRTECTIHRQCPRRPVQMLVAWIAEFHRR